MHSFVLFLYVVMSYLPAAATGDWPQWRGPRRDGVSAETGLQKQWPAEGPKKVWSAKGLGHGYGSAAVRGDFVYLQGTQGQESVVFCLQRRDGRIVWTRALGPSVDNDRGGGPRGTPTLDGDRLYALTEAGDLGCLDARSGSVLWKKNLLKEFNGRNITWLISESPLVDGNNLIVTPGGDRAGMVALNKISGQPVWKCEGFSEAAGYASCIAADISGVRILMTITSAAAVGVRASDGVLMWHYPKVANRTANIATPVYANGKVFVTTAYGTGCALLSLKASGGAVTADEVYFNRDMMNHHGGVVLIDGYLYGFSNSILTCMEFETGKTMWRHRSVGKGSLTAADGSLYLLSENNTVGLADASPTGYTERGRFGIEDQGLPSWAHPVIAGRRLFIRNQDYLSCYDISAQGAAY